MERKLEFLNALAFSAPPGQTVWCRSLDICGVISHYDKAMIRRVGQDYDQIVSSLDLKLHLSESDQITKILIRDDGKEFLLLSAEGHIFLADMDNLKNEVLSHSKLARHYGPPPQHFDWLQFKFEKTEWQDDLMFEGQLCKVPSISKQRKLMSKLQAIRNRNCLTLLVTADQQAKLKFWMNFDFFTAELPLSQFLMRGGVSISSSGLQIQQTYLLDGLRSLILQLTNSSKAYYLFQLDCQIVGDRIMPHLSNISYQVSLISTLLDYCSTCMEKAQKLLQEAVSRIKLKLELYISATRDALEKEGAPRVETINIREDFQALMMTGRVTSGLRSYLKDFVESQQVGKIHEFANEKSTQALDLLSSKLKNALTEIWLRLNDLKRRAAFKEVYGALGLREAQLEEIVSECDNLIAANQAEIKEVVRMQLNLSNFLVFLQSRGKIFVDPSIPVDSKNPLKSVKLNLHMVSEFLDRDEEFNFEPMMLRFRQEFPEEEKRGGKVTTRAMKRKADGSGSGGLLAYSPSNWNSLSMPSLMLKIKEKLGAYVYSRIPEAVAGLLLPGSAIQLNSPQESDPNFRFLASNKAPDNNSLVSCFLRSDPLSRDRKVLVCLRVANLEADIDESDDGDLDKSFESKSETTKETEANAIAVMGISDLPGFELREAAIHRDDTLILLYESDHSILYGLPLTELNWQRFKFDPEHIKSYVVVVDDYIKPYIEEIGVQEQLKPCFEYETNGQKLRGLSCGDRRIFSLQSELNELCFFEFSQFL